MGLLLCELLYSEMLLSANSSVTHSGGYLVQNGNVLNHGVNTFALDDRYNPPIYYSSAQ